MVKSIVLTYDEKTFRKIEKVKREIKKVSGMNVFSWENFILDQIFN